MAFWLIIIAFLALLAYQNWDFFMSQHGLRIDLLVTEYQTPQLQNAVLFLIFFFAGLLISYFFTLLERYKSKKMIKSLSASLEMNQRMLEEMRKELQSLKGEAPPDSEVQVTQDTPEAKDSNAS